MIYSRTKRNKIVHLLNEVSRASVPGELLNTSVNELPLSTRACNTLFKIGVKTISDLINFPPEKLCTIRYSGEKAIIEIGKSLQELLLPYVDTADNNLNESVADPFKKVVEAGYNDKVLDLSVEELNLSTKRALSALKRANLKTIRDVIDYGALNLLKNKNVGRQSIEDIKNAIMALHTYKSSTDTLFVDDMNSILTLFSPKYLHIIKTRYGYDDGKKATLEKIGTEEGVTRERIRQITESELRRIRHYTKRKSLQTVIENIERLLLRYNGIVSIREINEDKYFIAASYKHLRFFTYLIEHLFSERYRVIDEHFLTSLDDKEIKEVQSKIRDVALKCDFPIDEKGFLKIITSSIGPLSEDYLAYYLFKEKTVISKGKVLSPGKLSVAERVSLLMKKVNRPMHYTEITELYKKHFTDLKIRAIDLERALHVGVSTSKDFIIIGPGTFILRNQFAVPDNIEEIVRASKAILQNLKGMSDTKYLITELKKRKIDIGNLNAFSLKSILLGYPGFVSGRKFEIGIEGISNSITQKRLSDLIVDLLSAAPKAMHAKAIWEKISKQRGIPRSSIEQSLANDPAFIKIAPATYTIATHIDHYREKRDIVTNFTKEWIQLKKRAVSAFFVSEVLKEVHTDNSFSLGLVEHILATNSEFNKLPSGFYDLMHR